MVEIPPISSREIATLVGGKILRGDEMTCTELGDPLNVGAQGVAFIISDKYLKEVSLTKAGVLVIQAKFAEAVSAALPATVRVCIECRDAYLGLAKLTQRVVEMSPALDWEPATSTGEAIHPSATVDPSAKIGPGVIVGPRAAIGAGTVILGNAAIGTDARIGASCKIFPGVAVYPRTIIGDRVRVHANAVLGSDGFGYSRDSGASVKIWHLGKLVIGNDVEIGAAATIDRGTINDTVVEDGVKIDNLVQVGHNGHIKSHATICALVGLSGNVTIGKRAILAGLTGVADKLEVGDGAIIGPMSGVSKDVKPGTLMFGKHPVRPRREWWKLAALYERLPELFERIKKLENSREDPPKAS